MLDRKIHRRVFVYPRICHNPPTSICYFSFSKPLSLQKQLAIKLPVSGDKVKNKHLVSPFLSELMNLENTRYVFSFRRNSTLRESLCVRSVLLFVIGNWINGFGKEKDLALKWYCGKQTCPFGHARSLDWFVWCRTISKVIYQIQIRKSRSYTHTPLFYCFATMINFALYAYMRIFGIGSCNAPHCA